MTEIVKQSILNAYAVTPDGYRQKFRRLVKESTQTFAEFAHELLRVFKKWVTATGVTDFDHIVNLLVLEQFKQRLPYSLVKHVEEKGETDLQCSQGGRFP